jgi:hypothetical protein
MRSLAPKISGVERVERRGLRMVDESKKPRHDPADRGFARYKLERIEPA